MVYFKFIFVDQGYELYDTSSNFDHCKIFDSSIWSSAEAGAGEDIA